jgi:hypothetical protein
LIRRCSVARALYARAGLLAKRVVGVKNLFA